MPHHASVDAQIAHLTFVEMPGNDVAHEAFGDRMQENSAVFKVCLQCCVGTTYASDGVCARLCVCVCVRRRWTRLAKSLLP